MSVAVVNPRLELGVYQTLPQPIACLIHLVWRMLGVGHYVVGIEPSTNRADGRLAARSRGELIEIQPQESRIYELELGVLPDAEAVNHFAERARAVRAGTGADRSG